MEDPCPENKMCSAPSSPTDQQQQHDSTAAGSIMENRSSPASEVVSEKDLQLPRDCFLLPKQNDGFQIPYYLSSESEVSRIRPPAVVKTWETRFAELDGKQQAAFHKFVPKVQAAPWYNSEKHDDWAMLRYLVARQYDISKAFDMLENTVKWLKETGSDEWVCEACMENPNNHMGQFVGWDRQHRPVMFMSMRWGPERKHPLRHMVCAFNHMVQMMPVGVEQWVCMSDFETYSHLRDGKPSMGLSVIRTIQDHFPERLGKMVCINPPTMFWVLYKLFYPVIDPVTREKVEFLYTEDKPSVYESFPRLFPDHVSQFLYDTYHRSKHNLPAKPLVWYPDPEGYPTDYEERKVQLKEMKNEAKNTKAAEKLEAKNTKAAEKLEAKNTKAAEKQAKKDAKKNAKGDNSMNSSMCTSGGVQSPVSGH